MSDSDVVIAGIGMMTSVGLSPAETSASVRSSLMRMTEIAWQDDHFQPFVVAEVAEDGLPDLAAELEADASLTYRESRLLRLGTAPLRQALANLPPGTEPPGLALALPEHDTTQHLDPARFVGRFALQTSNAFNARQTSAKWRGRAGGLLALGAAIRSLQAGRAPFILAGGIETYRDPYVLGILNSQGRVKTATNLDSFVPGEGAGFLLLATRASAAASGIASVGVVSDVTSGFEPGHMYSGDPYLGEGLAAAVRSFLSQRSGPFREVYSSMNGENYWAKEWGVSYLRNQASFDPAAGIHHPADCFGDVGAASGPLMAGLAALGILGNFRRSPAMVYCSSDRGERALMEVAGDTR